MPFLEALEALRRAEEEEEVLEWRKNHPGDDRGPANQNLSGSSDSTDTFAPQHFRRPYGGGYNDTVLDGDKTKPAGATGGNGHQQGRVGAYSRGESSFVLVDTFHHCLCTWTILY